MARSSAARRRQESEPVESGGRAGKPGVERADTGRMGRPVEFDRLIHERVRLGMVSALAVNPSLSFNELKEVLDTSDGNLSVHARRLEEAGYVDCEKTFEGRIPRTEYRLTVRGRRALSAYLEHMEQLIRFVREPLPGRESVS